jgi:hypothetical protein
MLKMLAGPLSEAGRSFDGHSPDTHITDAWPQAGPPVLWTRELGQDSAFVAHGRRVFTQYQNWPFDPAGVYPGPRRLQPLNMDEFSLRLPADWWAVCRQSMGIRSGPETLLKTSRGKELDSVIRDRRRFSSRRRQTQKPSLEFCREWPKINQGH